MPLVCQVTMLASSNQTMKVLRRDGISAKARTNEDGVKFPISGSLPHSAVLFLGGSRRVPAVTACCTCAIRDCLPNRGLYIPGD